MVILHLKRYELDSDYTKYKKKLDTVDVPIELDLGMNLKSIQFNIPFSCSSLLHADFPSNK